MASTEAVDSLGPFLLRQAPTAQPHCALYSIIDYNNEAGRGQSNRNSTILVTRV
jgi:hypothetical protein